MKILKRILIVLAVIIGALLVLAIFLNKECNVERTIVINKPRQEVFNYIKNLKNQVHYSKWVMLDPNARMTYTGTDGTVGFVSAWDSDNKDVGKGSQTITKLVEGERMDLDLHFIKPFDGKATAFMNLTDEGGKTKVKWGFSSQMPYPMNLMLLTDMMPKMLGDALAEGLGNLKKELEK